MKTMAMVVSHRKQSSASPTLEKPSKPLKDIEADSSLAYESSQRSFAQLGLSILHCIRLLSAWDVFKLVSTALALVTLALLGVAGCMFKLDLTVGQVQAGALQSSLASQQFTVRMNTFRRNKELKASVDHLSKCPAVAQIQIVWSDQQNEPPPVSFFSAAAAPLVVFERHDTDSLNNRFIATLQPPTDGVFSVDDDMLFDCEDLVFAFNIWRSGQRSMVGFVPRLVVWDAAEQAHRYKSWWYTWWNGAYNIVLTKAAFMHQRYLTAYSEVLPAAALEYIDKHKNCEDIAMSFVVAKESGAPPIWVKGKVNELGADGISGTAGHFERRSACIDYFASLMGGVPLQTSTNKAVAAKTLWWW